MEACRERGRRIESSTERGVLSILIGPVDRAEVSEWILALDLHDVDLSARRPANRTDAIAEHPESRPDALPFRRVDAGLDPRVDAERLFALRFHARRRVSVAAEVLTSRFDHEVAVFNPRVHRSIRV